MLPLQLSNFDKKAKGEFEGNKKLFTKHNMYFELRKSEPVLQKYEIFNIIIKPCA